jgi:hypothetical protein
MNEPDLFLFDSYMEELIGEFIDDGKKSTAETYGAALKRIRQCFGKSGIRFSEVDKAWVLEFREYLIKSSLSINSVNTYLNVTRRVHKKALSTFQVKGIDHPFDHVTLPVCHAFRPVLESDVLRRMRNAELNNGYEYLMFSRDLFLFSHYAGGMSFRDIAYLKKTNLRKGQLFYRRSRSGCEMCVQLTIPMCKIIRWYMADGLYAFPIIQQPEKDDHQQYRSGLRKYNLHLIKLAKLLHIKEPLYTPMKFETEEKGDECSQENAAKLTPHANSHETQQLMSFPGLQH